MNDPNITFESLPRSVKETILWELELEYDHYESSKVSEIMDILNGNSLYEINEAAIKAYWSALTPDSLIRLMSPVLSDLESQVVEIRRIEKYLFAQECEKDNKNAEKT